MLVSVCLLGSVHTLCQVYLGCHEIHLKLKSRPLFNSSFFVIGLLFLKVAI